MSLGPGTRLGPYEILAAIGAGGMGEVYRARDTRLKRDVALKILPESFASDRDRLARFQREAEVLAALNHPHIAAIYGIEEVDSVRALVLELVEGETLADRIARGAIPLDEALPIAKQVAEALEAAHDQGIIHRDLKPANVKLRLDGTAKVLDFGLAKLTDVKPDLPDRDSNVSFDWTREHPPFGGLSMATTQSSPAGVTGVGMLLGTAAYMSPEQARGRAVDKRTDIWAFGCVLFEMLTGKRAFSGEDVTETLAAVVKSGPQWDGLPEALSPSLRVFLRRCLEKDPKQRVGDIRDVRLALEGAFEPATVITPKRTNRERWAWMTAFALTTVLVGAVTTSRFVDSSSDQLPSLNLSVVPPVGSSFTTFADALSPDGRRLAFIASGKLWIRDLGISDPQAISDVQEDVKRPFWSPDGRFIAFFDSGALKSVEARVGAKPRILSDNVPTANGGTWNDGGTILFARGNTIHRVGVGGGVPVPVTQLDEGLDETAHLWPAFLPDGQHFLYLALSRKPENRAVYVGSINSSTRTRLSEINEEARFVPPAHLLFGRNGSLGVQTFDPNTFQLRGEPSTLISTVRFNERNGQVAFSTSQSGIVSYQAGGEVGDVTLTWFDRHGQRVGTVGEPADYISFRLSPEGTRLAFDRGSNVTERHIWFMDLARGTSTRLTFGGRIEKAPVWSPDGKNIGFSTANGELHMVAADGSGHETVLASYESSIGRDSDWSPDGRFIVTEVGYPVSDLLIVPTSGRGKAAFFVQSQFNEGYPRFSPDGNWIAYTSDETGAAEVYVRPFPGPGAKMRVSSEGGYWPRWRRDGKELFYVSNDRILMSVPIDSTAAFKPGIPQALFRTPIQNSLGLGLVDPLEVSPDGQRFLFIPGNEQEISEPLRIVVNWQALLKPQ